MYAHLTGVQLGLYNFLHQPRCSGNLYRIHSMGCRHRSLPRNYDLLRQDGMHDLEYEEDGVGRFLHQRTFANWKPVSDSVRTFFELSPSR